MPKLYYPMETATETSEGKVINASCSSQKVSVGEANIRAQLAFQHMQMRLEVQRYQYEMEIREQKQLNSLAFVSNLFA